MEFDWWKIFTVATTVYCWLVHGYSDNRCFNFTLHIITNYLILGSPKSKWDLIFAMPIIFCSKAINFPQYSLHNESIVNSLLLLSFIYSAPLNNSTNLIVSSSFQYWPSNTMLLKGSLNSFDSLYCFKTYWTSYPYKKFSWSFYLYLALSSHINKGTLFSISFIHSMSCVFMSVIHCLSSSLSFSLSFSCMKPFFCKFVMWTNYVQVSFIS